MAKTKRKANSTKRATTQKNGGAMHFVAHEVLAVMVTAFASFLVFALVSIQPVVSLLCTSVSTSICGVKGNLMGPVGSSVGTFLFSVFGFGSLVAGILAVIFAVNLWQYSEENKKAVSPHPKVRQMVAVLATLVCVASIFSFWFPVGARAIEHGGLVGYYAVKTLNPLFGSFGSTLILFCTLLLTVQYAVEKSIVDITRSILATLMRSFALIGKAMLFVSDGVYNSCGSIFSATASGILFTFRFLVKLFRSGALGASRFFGGVFRAVRTIGHRVLESRNSARLSQVEQTVSELTRPSVSSSLSRQKAVNRKKTPTKSLADEKIVVVTHESQPATDAPVSHSPSSHSPSDTISASAVGGSADRKVSASPEFVDYVPPSYDLLEAKKASEKVVMDEDELVECSKRIQEKLADFNVHGRVTHVHPGPVITMYEFEPAAGVKVGKIVSLQDDLAMALRSTSVRIIAPLAERGTVGIEVPNDEQEIVRLSELLGNEELEKMPSRLAIPIGKDTFGKAVSADIAAMPHLLMAGATGTGKSVCINALLISMLYRAHPRELQLILIDPKILELSVYEGIPHLKVPVVSDPRKAKAVLQWAVKEMDRRYRLLKDYGVRSIDAFNDMISSGEPRPVTRSNEIQAKVIDVEDPLPKIVIVIDELADLMLMSGRDVEELITRLAQKARAAGIHMILATQRPSVDVITGLIKANFPARISFRVSSRIDSRTILDSMGSERLLGKGDMLFLKPGVHSLQRVHGAFVSDHEVREVTRALREGSQPEYDQEILEMCEKALEDQGASTEANDDDFVDPLYDKALHFVVEKGQASTSMVQRAFRIGYNRAARIVDMLEREGVVGPMDGSKPRQVIVHKQ